MDLKPPSVLPVLPAHLQAPKNFEPISMARPVDRRSDRKIGMAVTSVDLPIPYLMVANDAAVWVGNGLASGLENAGYTINPVKDVKSADTTYVIGVEVTEVGFRAGLRTTKTVVGATVELDQRGKQAFRREYQGVYTGKTVGAPPEEAASARAEVLNLALENFLEKAVPDLASELVHSSDAAQKLTLSDKHATQ